MLIADSYVGHREEPAVAARLSGTDPERVVLTDTDRRRSHVRTRTAADRELGLVVGRELRDGDVLETQDGRLLVVELANVPALVLEFANADVAPTAALALGHALGNRHWGLAVRETEALVPVAESRERMEATVADRLPEGVTTRFEDVPPTTFDDGTPDHGHDHGDVTGSHAVHEHGHGTGETNGHGVHRIEEDEDG